MWQAVREFLETILGALVAFYSGSLMQENRRLQRELERAEKAAKARADVRLMSDDDVVRALKERGLYRDDEPPADGKRQ